jgi:NADH:ubiquinone oxidoreductase subunit D
VYNELLFSSAVSKSMFGDNFDRAVLRIFEMRQSLKLIFQCLNMLPEGLIKNDDYKFCPPTRILMKSSMEALIHHFKLYSTGFFVRAGEVYSAVESPKGEFGVFLYGDSSNKPYRCKVRSPGYFHLQGLQFLAQNLLLADVVGLIGSLDIVFGEIDR